MSSLVSVPTIDFSAFEGSDTEAHKRVVREIADACESVGFFQVVNHGIDDDVVSDALRVSREFFELPLEQKMKVNNLKKGYIPVGGCSNAVRPTHLHEKFSCGPVDVNREDPYYSGSNGDNRAALYFGEENRWPAAPKEFESKYASYYRECTEFVSKLHRAFAYALKLPTEFFVEKSKKQVSNLVALRYPKNNESDETSDGRNNTHTTSSTSKNILVHPHTDPTDVTVLRFENGPKGLQVLPDGCEEWIDVPNVKNSLLVNLGDAAQFWTNDKWKSTRHRVNNVSGDESTDSKSKTITHRDRMSLVFFHAPEYDAVVDAGELAMAQQCDDDDINESVKVVSEKRKQKYVPFQYSERTHFAQLERNSNGLPDRQTLREGNERGLL